MKLMWFCVLFICIMFPGFCETIYVYTHEMCDEEPVPYDYQVKEGLLDGLFEAGHIVFDDVNDSFLPDLITTENIDTLIITARTSGAYYLLAVRIVSHMQDDTNPKIIESTAVYYLYDVMTREIVKQGNTTIDNAGDMGLGKKKFWFELGLFISEEISRVYEEKE